MRGAAGRLLRACEAAADGSATSTRCLSLASVRVPGFRPPADDAARSGGLLAGSLLDQHPHDVAFLHDEVLGAVDLHLGARPLAEQHTVADLDVERNELAGFVAAARPDGDD